MAGRPKKEETTIDVAEVKVEKEIGTTVDKEKEQLKAKNDEMAEMLKQM